MQRGKQVVGARPQNWPLGSTNVALPAASGSGRTYGKQLLGAVASELSTYVAKLHLSMRVSYVSVPQECPAKVSDKSVLQECFKSATE